MAGLVSRFLPLETTEYFPTPERLECRSEAPCLHHFNLSFLTLLSLFSELGLGKPPQNTHNSSFQRMTFSPSVSPGCCRNPSIDISKKYNPVLPLEALLGHNDDHSDSTASITGVLTRVTLTDFRKFTLGVTTLHTQCSPIKIVFPHFLFLHAPTFA